MYSPPITFQVKCYIVHTSSCSKQNTLAFAVFKALASSDVLISAQAELKYEIRKQTAEFLHHTHSRQ